jgi:hypothetical protein
MTFPKGEDLKVLVPIWNRREKGWCWPDIEIFESKGKGQGVRARKALAKGATIPYLGRILSAKECNQLEVSDFVVEKSATTYVDGNPNLDPAMSSLCIGALVNEASEGEQYNCTWVGFRGSKGLGLVLVEDVKKGQELLVYYGNQYVRDYSIARAPPSRRSQLKLNDDAQTVVNHLYFLFTQSVEH